MPEEMDAQTKERKKEEKLVELKMTGKQTKERV